MIKSLKKACLSLMALAIALTASAEGDAKSTKASGFDWNPVMDAIIQVESEGNPNAVSGNSVGVMQITPILEVLLNTVAFNSDVSVLFW